MPITIETFAADRDLAAVRSFLTATDLDRLQRCLSAIDTGAAIARCVLDHGAAIGIALAHLQVVPELGWDDDSAALMSGPSCYLENIELAPSARRRGLGTRVLAALEAACAQRRKQRLVLHTSQAQLEPFYVHCGYQLERIVHPPWRQGRPVRIYAKSLVGDGGISQHGPLDAGAPAP